MLSGFTKCIPLMYQCCGPFLKYKNVLLQNALMVCMETGVKSSVDIVQTYPSVTTLMDLV